LKKEVKDLKISLNKVVKANKEKKDKRNRWRQKNIRMKVKAWRKFPGLYKDWFLDYASYVILDRLFLRCMMG
jgi:hypothetical protein